MMGESEYRLPFEKLHVWHLSRAFAGEIYGVTKGFPRAEHFGLAGQMNRAAVSVMSNIAEGSARTSCKDQAHFSQLAYSSLMEVACQLQLAADLGFCHEGVNRNLRKQILEISGKLNALRRSQLAKNC